MSDWSSDVCSSDLEGGVLAVVGEGEKLLRCRSEGGLLAKVLDGRHAEHGGGRRTALGTERGQLREVGAHGPAVGHAAAQTHSEGGRNQIGRESCRERVCP